MAERSLEVTFLAAVKAGVLDILGLFDSAQWFRQGADWTAWRAFLAAVYGLPMSDREYDIYRICTGRKDPPRRKVRETWLGVGRRGRKSAIMATIGVYEAAFCDHDNYLAPGEYVRVPVMSKNKDDAAQIRRYAGELLNDPALAWLLEGQPTTELIRLRTRAEISIRAASIMGGRTFATRAALLDEQAYWPTDDAAEPDIEVLRGIKPSMANVPGALIVGASSLYARRGLLYAAMRDYWGVDGQDDVLAWKATTLMMHDTPAIRSYVDQAWKDDPASAVAEVGRPEKSAAIEFRTDVETYMPIELIEAITDHDQVTDRPPQLGVQYVAFVDPSGGSGDAMTLAIAHYDQRHGKSILDALRETPAPFDPDTVAREHCALLKTYRVHQVTGDAYAGEWPRSAYQRGGHAQDCPQQHDHRATCSCAGEPWRAEQREKQPAGGPWRVGYDVSEFDRSELYSRFLPLARAGRVVLLRHQALLLQLQRLERKVYRQREIIDHPAGNHDDIANAVAGALVHCDLARAHMREAEPPPADNIEAHTRQIQGWIRDRLKRQAKASRRTSGRGTGVA